MKHETGGAVSTELPISPYAETTVDTDYNDVIIDKHVKIPPFDINKSVEERRINNNDVEAIIQLARYAFLIGQGAYGMLYLLNNIYTDRLVVCKIIAQPVSRHYDIWINSIEREVGIQSECSIICKPHVPPVLAWGVAHMPKTGTHALIIMDFLGYKKIPPCIYRIISLSEIVDIIKKKRASSNVYLDIIPQLIGTIAKIHRAGYLHRDIKPENLMYDVENKILYVIDFGMAISQAPMRYPAGSPIYIHPFDLFTNISTTCSDVWAIGMTLSCLFEKHRTFNKIDKLSYNRTIQTARQRTNLKLSDRQLSLQEFQTAIQKPKVKQIRYITQIFHKGTFKDFNCVNTVSILVKACLHVNHDAERFTGHNCIYNKDIQNLLDIAINYKPLTNYCTESLVRDMIQKADTETKSIYKEHKMIILPPPTYPPPWFKRGGSKTIKATYKKGKTHTRR